jgi:hypothetical protein
VDAARTIVSIKDDELRWKMVDCHAVSMVCTLSKVLLLLGDIQWFNLAGRSW